MAVASAGMTDSAASAISTTPSGSHAVCLESMNQELDRPDLRVNSPVRTECSSRCRTSAAWVSGAIGASGPGMQPTLPKPPHPLPHPTRNRPFCAASRDPEVAARSTEQDGGSVGQAGSGSQPTRP